MLINTAMTTSSPDQWVWGMTPEAWLTVIALLIGPVAAVLIQRWRERVREERGKKLWVFRELMVTRGTRMSGRHVEALNSIDVEFYGHRDVLEAWQTYFELFVKGRREDASEEEVKRWLERGDDLLVDLVFAMAQALGITLTR